jgi:release factor glutamine methyltransferase
MPKGEELYSPERVAELLRRGAARLEGAGIDTPRLDAETLLAAALGLERLELLLTLDRRLGPEQVKIFDGFLDRRCLREPLSQILGRREFWSLDFRVTADTLTPRPDSETLIEAALAWLDRNGLSRQASLRILDLGTGSGCLLLALLSELPNSFGVGVDRSLAALHVARENAFRLGLANQAGFILGDWASAIGGGRGFDIILSNPPYISSADIAKLGPEVCQFEPLAALEGGADGLAAYRQLAPEFKRLLNPEGAVFLEIGAGQASDVMTILKVSGGCHGVSHKDLSGLERCIEANIQ